MLQYQIIETVRSGQTQYVGRIKLVSCLDQERLLDRMVEKNTSLRRETLAAALMLLKTTVAELCREGHAVRLDGFVRFCPVLGGSFTGHEDVFDRKRHNVGVAATAAKALRTSMQRKLSMHRVDSSNLDPEITVVEDHESGTRNAMVTPGQIVSLKGRRLKFDPKNPEEVLEFRNVETPAQKAAILKPVISSTEVYFVMPPVPFREGIFVLTRTLSTTRARTGTSLPVRVAPGTASV